ncbi:MAG: sulfite exporter TauE/SafE family protein [Candidatus Thorarchaeota archaeon]|nr:sulfite exporter TauE/SafE family protein [Candidatus Thorarchaeota archaeon]
MDPMFMIALLITGAAVGLISGMLGVGGCFIMIPVQYYILLASGIDPTIAIRVSFGTNLLVVLPTALSGAFRHHTKEVVMWKPAITLGVVGAVAGFFGAFVASQLPGNILTLIFGLAILLGSVRMITAKPIRTEGEVSQSTAAYVFWGIVLGFVTGLIGIGGGVLVIPVMILFLNFQMHEAVGTSTAMMIFTATGGALSYMILGLGVVGLPEFSIGYVNLLQWILLAGTSIPLAQLGAHSAHKVNPKVLKWIFIVVMIYMGLKMIGLFSFLGLPI